MERMPALPARTPPRRVLLLLVAGLVTAACSGDARHDADPTSLRPTTGGDVVGLATGGAQQWRGIPFAASTAGAARWRAPQPPAPWSGVREALAFGPQCPQLDPGSGVPSGDEDCLTLNVFAPATTAEDIPRGPDRWPVMVFIHGGGNTIGSAEVYDASRFAAENEVVVVTVHYRLGIFGWFSHAALRAGDASPDDASGNYGTLDLIRSLEWVRDNIDAFGGDPGRVTIFGESAGGINVFSLLLSPRAKGLFHRAISQSGIATSFTRAEAENASDAKDAPGTAGSATDVMLSLLVSDGRAGSREEAHAILAAMSASEIADWLRSKSPAEMFTPFTSGEGAFGAMYFAPFVIRDGHVILDMAPLDAFRTGAHNAVPTILGTNRDENKLFQSFISPHVRRLGPFPIGFIDETRYDVTSEYGSRLWKAQGADEPAAAMHADGRPPVFGYRFDWDEEPSILGVDLARLIGAGHAVELLFVFGGTDSSLARWLLVDDAASAEILSSQMRSYWAAFAATGDPGRGQDGSLPSWPAWQGARPEFLLFDSPRDGGIGRSSETESVAGVVSGVARDARLSGPEARCEVYAGFVQWSSAMTPADYERVGDGECTAYPLVSRSPFDP